MKHKKNAESYEVRHAERIATVSFDNTEIGQPQKENEKRRSGFASFKYQSCKFCGGSWHKRADCPAKQRLVTNAFASAISQKFVYQKLRKSRRRLRQCAKTKKSTGTSVH